MIIGLIINPIAGMGGRVGLKGTDGPEILREAIRRGANPISGDRAREALRSLEELEISWVTWEGEMGETILEDLGLNYIVGGKIEGENPTNKDTQKAAEQMKKLGVDLILFVGGDGTAVDIYQAINMSIPVLGIPSGVKMYSAVFARTPRSAKELVHEFIKGDIPLVEREVMDIDEEAYRGGRLSTNLKGVLKVPYRASMVLSDKTAISQADVEAIKEAIAARVVENMKPEVNYILGPGSTVNKIAEKLKIDKTLLGVDVVKWGKLIIKDANERQILSLVSGTSQIILSPLGGQGSLLGHGNQQISPKVIRKVGIENIIVVATPVKLQELKSLSVDTGDPELDEELKGYIRVIVGYHETKIMHVI
jgi:predicted polyphosphate/ATP-dependent NAD kinase